MVSKFKIYSLFVGIMFLGACKTTPNVPTIIYQEPEWYEQQSISLPNYLIGYGQGDTIGEAKIKAKLDISQTMESNIKGEHTLTARLTQHGIEKTTEENIQILSSAKLSDLKALKTEKVGTTYYIALAYDLRPLSQKVIDKFQIFQPTRQAGLLETNAMFQQLKKELGYYPKLTIYSKNQRYYISDGEQQQQVSTEEVPSLFPDAGRGQLQIELTPYKLVYEPEELFFVKTFSNKSGYLSYLQIFDSGETVLMQRNSRIQGKQNYLYPDNKFYDGLATELKPGKVIARVVHLAILCQEPRSFNAFDAISTKTYQDYDSYALGQLNDLTKDCETTSYIQLIRK